MASSKQNILFHFDGVNACDNKQFEHALGLFSRIQDPPAVILFNIASCYLNLKKYHLAIEAFGKCVVKDRYMVVGHFQLASAYTLNDDIQSAITSYNDAISSLRGNSFIDYKQLHMSAKIYASEVYFNLALLHLFNTNIKKAGETMKKAIGGNTFSPRQSAIEDAFKHLQLEDWDYFGNSVNDKLIKLPEDTYFRPSKAKLEGIQSSTKFMDNAQVLSASKEEYSFVGFVGPAKLKLATGKPFNKSRRPSPPNTVPPPVPTVAPPRLPPNHFQPISSSVSNNNTESPNKLPPARPAPSRPSPKQSPRSSPIHGYTPPNRESILQNKTTLQNQTRSPQKSSPKLPPPVPPMPSLKSKTHRQINVTCKYSFSIPQSQIKNGLNDVIKNMEQKFSALSLGKLESSLKNKRTALFLDNKQMLPDQSTWESAISEDLEPINILLTDDTHNYALDAVSASDDNIYQDLDVLAGVAELLRQNLLPRQIGQD